MIQVKTFYFNDLRECSYVLYDDTKECVIVDPGMQNENEQKRLVKFIEENGLTPVKLLNTHGHFDHIMSVDTLRQAEPDLKVYIHEADAPMLTDGDKNAFSLFFGQDRVWKEADILLTDGHKVAVGGTAFTVVHPPGHSPGSVCYLCESEGILLTGDTLFADNIGRCDLWGGSYAVMRQSLKRLREFDGALTIYPGHGDTNQLSRALDNTMYI